MQFTKKCPSCGYEETGYKNPYPTVDIIIKVFDKNIFKGIVLVYRKNYPKLWALPGGFIDYGESAEKAAIREALEETNLKITNLRQFRVYSEPDRDPRKHTITTAFIAEAEGEPKAADDAEQVKVFTESEIPDDLAFDHNKILNDFFKQEKP